MSTEPGEGGGTPAISTTSASQRPLITPEPFSGTRTFSEWIEHFEAVAAINKWDDAAKLLWLRVRLVGGAQTAYGRLPAEAKGSYAELIEEGFEGAVRARSSQRTPPRPISNSKEDEDRRLGRIRRCCKAAV